MTGTGRSALVIIDVQQGFSDESWGPTTNHPTCEENIDLLAQRWGSLGWPVVVVRHDSVLPGSPLNPAAAGNSLTDSVAAVAHDLLVTKSVNSAFYGTPDLHEWLRGRGIASVVLCGIQTNMCVETTARMAGNLGLDVTVALDATRTFDLAGPDGTTIPAAELMRTTATNLHGGRFARVVSTEELLAGLGEQGIGPDAARPDPSTRGQAGAVAKP